jgi:hypothetical protein
MHKNILCAPLAGRHSRHVLALAAISILTIFNGLTSRALAQCNWSTKVVTSLHTNAPPGLTATSDRLILTWGGSGDGAFNSAYSFDGITWTHSVLHTDFPRITRGHTGGLGMTYSTTCGYVYAAWRDDSNRMWATRSAESFNWEAPHLILNPAASAGASAQVQQPVTNVRLPCDRDPDCEGGGGGGGGQVPGIHGIALSAPVLRGDNGSLPIGFAVSTNSNIVSGKFSPLKGKFNCDFSNPVYPIQPGFFSNFFGHVSTNELQKQPSTPAWAGGGGTELNAVASGALTIVDSLENMYYELNNNGSRAVSFTTSFWSNNGIVGTVNPNDGTPYLAWTCHPDEGDTCSPESSGKINLLRIVPLADFGGVHIVCGDWSVHNPAVTFFQGKIWIAWRGNGSDDTGYINVASINPF